MSNKTLFNQKFKIMKKLSIEKFRISELKNTSRIYGGNTDTGNQDPGTGTGGHEVKEICAGTTSKIKIYK